MPEIEPLFAEMTDTLRHARIAVQNELEPLVKAEAAERQTLRRILQSVRSFEAQAESLFQMIFGCRVDQASLDDAEDLADFFQRTVVQIEAMLAAGWG